MAFDLDSIRSTKETRPPILLLHGVEGMGKTTFIAGAPGVVIIPTEDRVHRVSAKAFPVVKTTADFCAAVQTLLDGDHEFESVGLDTIDHLERIVQKEVAAENNVENVEEIPYGKGAAIVADRLAMLVDMLISLRNKRNMAVFIAAHTETKRVEDPMHAATFDKHQIKLSKKSIPIVRELMDYIGFARLDTHVTTQDKGFGKERGIALPNAPRVLMFAKSDAYESKSIDAFPAQIPFTTEAFMSAYSAAQEN